jgi:hypothetical protein
MLKQLHGHISHETGYLVDSYPYGRLRCRIWFWLEFDQKKGYRFCSVTENPKNGRINAPKKSTYQHVIGAMYLDEKGHVTWSAINEYTGWAECLKFIENFPQADLSRLHRWAEAKCVICKQWIKKYGESETNLQDLAGWEQVRQALTKNTLAA